MNNAEMRQHADEIEESARRQADASGVPWKDAEAAVVAAILSRGRESRSLFTPHDASYVVRAMKVKV